MSTQQPLRKKRATVANFYEHVPKAVDRKKVNPNYDVHGIDIPFRMLIVGASGSMKTNSAMDVFEKFNGTFDHVTVVCRNKDEPLYNLLAKSLPDDQVTMIEIENDDLRQIPALEGNSDSPQTLVIFDDLCLVKNQKPIEEFFIRSRKLNISCMYLTQSYYASPKNIRINCFYVILKKIDSTRDLRLLLSEYSLNIELDQLVQLYTECTKNKLDWLMIAMQNPPEDRFFHNYDHIDPPSSNGCTAASSLTPEASSDEKQPHTEISCPTPKLPTSAPKTSQLSMFKRPSKTPMTLAQKQEILRRYSSQSQ